ncbi:ring-1,2-phenylacetyl-CoA epoxidase subunit PaaD [Nakamurella panacisegetis]|uniref:Ring-1,2-phenylacetyl-CoA epoxidase subunit PaaD n=1 Tax=Nakamurella panacisegetis TaxID=1090615 RepID=A0A1H0NG81_9ACTN|nr:1,2-phenylacetyl-CoA epoxidase subunit PaaD [Nakamurella panacisegetis]SDO91757.1 ring-1,2-phenylacetyl-CoA epoxidase subunit PaaD [Nakamurella panacisegetis]
MVITTTNPNSVRRERAWAVAARVPDPELPMVTLADLGILRDVRVDAAGVTVTITPTYSGCPAMREISHDLQLRLAQAGFDDIKIRTELSPPWSSDWITPDGRAKLSAAGIAPPNAAGSRPGGPIPLTLAPIARDVACPRCGSRRTEETSAFSATACKALYRCRDCAEPFEYVKEI